MTIKYKYYSILFILGTLTACKKNDGKDASNPPIINAQEQITTVTLTGYKTDSSAMFSVTWEDLDGPGGQSPAIDSLVLDTGTQYNVKVLLLDKTKTPWDTISNEVEEKKNVHQFFYTPDAGLSNKMSISILDYDDNTPPLPVGLSFVIKTQSSSAFELPFAGSLRMVLSHYDGIPKTATPSPESDIDIRFPVRLR